MKITKSGIFLLSLIFCLFTTAPLLHAQTDQTSSSTATIQALAPDEVPPVGTFYLFADYLSNSNHMAPPYPMNPYFANTNITVYDLGNRIYMVDNSSNITTDAQLEDALNALGQSQADLASPLMTMDAMEMDADTPSENGPLAADYTTSTNLWIEVATNAFPATNQFAVVLHNTIQDQSYDVLTTTNLLTPFAQWPVVQTVVGAEGDTTPVQITLHGEPNLFVIARYAGSSTGNLVSDIWAQTYFGTNNVDPYADPDNDGWSNYEEFLNGTSPISFDTPPPPKNLAARFDPSVSHALLTWESGGGPVSSYEIQYADQLSEDFAVDIGDVSASTLSFSDDLTQAYREPPYDVSSYRVVAHFPNGSSSATPWTIPGTPALNEFSDLNHLDRDYAVFRGPNHHAYFALQSPASDLAFVRFWGISNGTPAHFDVDATNMVGGIMQIPDSILDHSQNVFVRQFQLFSSHGEIGGFSGWFTVYVAEGDYEYGFPESDQNYILAQTQLKQNLRFLLRSATVNHAFSYESPIPTGLASGSVEDLNVPEASFVRSESPAEYEYAGYHFYSPNLGHIVLQGVRPVKENYLWRNFAFNTLDFISGDYATRGVSYDFWSELRRINDNPEYNYSGSGTETPLPYALTNFTWSFHWPFYADDTNLPPDDPTLLADLGLVQATDNYFSFPSTGARNLYGLPFNSFNYGDGENWEILYPGQTSTMQLDVYGSMGIDEPQLHTVDYYFASQTPYFKFTLEPYGDRADALRPLMPGAPGFAGTNAASLLFTAFAQPMTISGWARQTISNGYTGKFAFLEQYFDHAYTVGTNGIATSNIAGLLSPYGEFFPTNPGPAAIVTMADIETGQRGTGIVNVIKLQLDANHDGAMDTSFAGPDNTSEAKPFVFWINNDNDGAGIGTDIQVITNLQYDYRQGKIRSQRNLEDFARIWVCGIPTLPADYSVTLSWHKSYSWYDPLLNDGVLFTNLLFQGSPAINLYLAETNGGIGYLTDTNVAQSLTNETKLGTISLNSNYSFPPGFFDGSNKHFLFEGAGVGSGELMLTILRGTNIVARTSAWLDLHDVKDLYEQAIVTNVVQSWPEMVQTSALSGFRVLSTQKAITGTSNELAVFVHGWRMPEWEYFNFSESMFKRLYWEGYQGRFASLRWPTRSSDTDSNGLDFITFNRSEYISFRSASGAALYFYDLRQRFTNYSISVCAHSQGNILMMEALKELADVNQSPLDNCVLMEAAVPAHCYDTSITNLPTLINMVASIPTPNTYSNYASGMRSALRGGNICNLFNPADFALASGLSGTGFGSWENNQETMKPLLFFGYIYIATNQTAYVITNQYTVAFGITNLQNRIVTDPLELMPFVSRPHSKAVGAQAGVGNIVNGLEYNLQSQLGFTAATYDHSGQFNRNIQTPQVQGFYSRLQQSLFPPAP